MTISYLMLGSNMGDRLVYLNRSIALLNDHLGRITRLSAVYESEPWGFDNPCWFLNQAVALETHYPPHALLKELQQIEKDLGRTRTLPCYQARTIDIDILFYGNQVIHAPDLTIPHPRIAERMFVLQPLSELAPNLIHPVLGQTIKYLKMHCPDTLQVKLFTT